MNGKAQFYCKPQEKIRLVTVLKTQNLLPQMKTSKKVQRFQEIRNMKTFFGVRAFERKIFQANSRKCGQNYFASPKICLLLHL